MVLILEVEEFSGSSLSGNEKLNCQVKGVVLGELFLSWFGILIAEIGCHQVGCFVWTRDLSRR